MAVVTVAVKVGRPLIVVGLPFDVTAVLVAVPVASTDTPFIFQETTADFQAVTIQGQVTYRVGDPKRLAALLNYTLARDGEAYAAEDPEKLPERVINILHVLARAEQLIHEKGNETHDNHTS